MDPNGKKSRRGSKMGKSVLKLVGTRLEGEEANVRNWKREWPKGHWYSFLSHNMSYSFTRITLFVHSLVSRALFSLYALITRFVHLIQVICICFTNHSYGLPLGDPYINP